MSPPDLEKWIFYLEGKKPIWFPVNCQPKEIIELLKELRERCKCRHPNEIKNRIRWYKSRIGNNPLNHREERSIIRILEWVLNPDKEEKE